MKKKRNISCSFLSRGSEEKTYYDGEYNQRKIFKLIVDGARLLDLYRSNLRMVPRDVQPICQEMTIKINDEVDRNDKPNVKKLKTNEMDFSSMLNKTKQQGLDTCDLPQRDV